MDSFNTQYINPIRYSSCYLFTHKAHRQALNKEPEPGWEDPFLSPELDKFVYYIDSHISLVILSA